MCGILLFYGDQAKRRLNESIVKIKHRGPDETKTDHNGLLSIGFNRLAINDKSPLGSQPITYKNYLCVINGEIYNHSLLVDKYNLSIEGKCDTHIVPQLFELLGYDVISVLDGFYSGLIFNKKTHELFCLRDYIGKKPLFFGKSGTELFITSELKAVSHINSFEMLPKGISQIDINLKKIISKRHHSLNYPIKNKDYLKKIMEKSVVKRLPEKNEPVGVFLSGGLDSSIIASIVASHRNNAIYYTLVTQNSQDNKYVEILEKFLDLKCVKFIKYVLDDMFIKLIEKVIYATESYNPSIISNGICTYLLAKAAHKDGLKVVLSGEGADEMFCGYHMFEEHQDWKLIRKQLISDMHFTELRRIDQSCMAQSIEVRCPFLDQSIYSLASTLSYKDFFHQHNDKMVNKYILRKTFENILPQEIVYRKKTSFDVGSGIRALVVHHLTKDGKKEKEVLKTIWKKYFNNNWKHPYYHSYPVFDKVIEKRGKTHK